MVKNDVEINYICVKCIINVIKKENCESNCDSYKCLICNNDYHIKNNIVCLGHDPLCKRKYTNIPI